mgnify:FL=1
MNNRQCSKHKSIGCMKCICVPQKPTHVAVIVLGFLTEERGAVPELMKSELFAGMIGGIPKEARFFIGVEQ